MELNVIVNNRCNQDRDIGTLTVQSKNVEVTKARMRLPISL